MKFLLLLRVRPLVLEQIRAAPKRSPPDTEAGLLTGVGALVLRQVGAEAEALAAVPRSCGLLPRARALVLDQAEANTGSLATFGTAVRLLAHVAPPVSRLRPVTGSSHARHYEAGGLIKEKTLTVSHEVRAQAEATVTLGTEGTVSRGVYPVLLNQDLSPVGSFCYTGDSSRVYHRRGCFGGLRSGR